MAVYPRKVPLEVCGCNFAGCFPGSLAITGLLSTLKASIFGHFPVYASNRVFYEVGGMEKFPGPVLWAQLHAM